MSTDTIHRLHDEARALAERMPAIMAEASRVAHTVALGQHGRRRRGPGETFWQFRHFEQSDSAQLIDWRRSASSDGLYVREREWEAAHTVWIWMDVSPSMDFRSELAPEPKRDRAMVLGLALAQLLVAGGERVGLVGLTTASASRSQPTRLAHALIAAVNGQEAEGINPALRGSLPPRARLSAYSECVLISDFLEPAEEIIARMDDLAAPHVAGHLLQVLDPAEESLPYGGRVVFADSEDGSELLSERAEDWRATYLTRLAAHKAELGLATGRIQWSHLIHHTNRPAQEPLLALSARMAGLDRDYRFSPVSEQPTEGSDRP